VHRKMRLCQQAQTSDATGLRKLMPLGLSHRSKLQIDNDLLKQGTQQGEVGKRRRRAAMSLDDPLNSVHASTR